MRVKEWNIHIDDKKYEIEFYPSILFKFVFQLIINDELYKNIKYKLYRKGAEYNFDMDGHKVAIVMKVEKFKSRYELVVDGVTMDAKEPEDLI